MSKALRTKQFIIEKTAPIFNKKGYAGTSIADLTSATGLSKGSIYGNFENKDDIAIEAFDYNYRLVVNYIHEHSGHIANSIDRLIAQLTIYKNFFSLPFLQHGCPILNTAIEADDTHPILRERAAKALDSWKKSLQFIVEEGVSKKEIKKDADAKELAVVIILLIEGAIMQSKLSGRVNELDVAVNFLVKMLNNLRA